MTGHLKEAGLRILAPTNRNYIQRLINASKQAHLCKAHGHQSLNSRCSGRQYKDRCLTWGDLGIGLINSEKSAEVIVLRVTSKDC